MALSAKLKENHLMVLDKFDLDEIKTKKFLAVTKAIDVKNGLFVTDKKDEKLELSSRNVPKMKILRTEGLNVYDILKYERLILLESTLSGIEGRLGS
jgi:large subunit ribosomal protein L4